MFGNIFRKREKIEILDLNFTAKRMLDLTDSELKECSDLFGTYYGKYNSLSPIRPGEQIRMSVSLYKENYVKPDRYIAMARHNGLLVGHAMYIRKQYKECGKMTWVLQLVVDDRYRRQGIASTLLRSIWGFSDDFAWGLATANPCTVKTLENATFRKCKPEVIKKEVSKLKLIAKDTSFVTDEDFVITNMMSQVNSHFFIDNSEFLKDKYCEEKLGKLRPGHEWLAFTFQRQSIQMDQYIKHFDQFVKFSEKTLKEAYNRMQMDSHGWTKGTENESDFIRNYLQGSSIMDMGCGTGRHAINLSLNGYKVLGVDFSEKHIQTAIQKRNECGIGDELCQFIVSDIKYYQPDEQFDNVLLLFDVIGSYPNMEDNYAILKNAKEHLKNNGILILSVMNMELTSHQVSDSRKKNIKNNPEVLLKLKPSTAMQNTGEVFNADYLAIDTESGLVYRKEQFSNDEGLSAEYVIRDKRFTMVEITGILRELGFNIIEGRYVRAGHFDEPLHATDNHAKEILIVAKKKN